MLVSYIYPFSAWFYYLFYYYQQRFSAHKSITTQTTSKDKQIQGWLGGSPRPSAKATEILHPDECFSDGDNSSISAPTASTRSSAMVAVDVNDSDYRESLSLRGIYIERTKPPVELRQRATEVTGWPRGSLQMDNAASQDLVSTIHRLQTANEDELKELTPKIIPAIGRDLDERLARCSNQVWLRAVAIPLLPEYLDVKSLLLLPRPKPDLVFGYSKSAFTKLQLGTILHLADDESGHSYAMPDQTTRFPFFAIEFKSQAKKGTHYVATNQAAGAGAIALNGQLELMRRSCTVTALDKIIPRFFSVIIDQAFAQINAHWVGGGPTEDEPYSFHVEKVARHFLDSAEGATAVVCAVENILVYGADVLLPAVCEALDAYRAAMTAAKASAAGGGWIVIRGLYFFGGGDLGWMELGLSWSFRCLIDRISFFHLEF